MWYLPEGQNKRDKESATPCMTPGIYSAMCCSKDDVEYSMASSLARMALGPFAFNLETIVKAAILSLRTQSKLRRAIQKSRHKRSAMRRQSASHTCWPLSVPPCVLRIFSESLVTMSAKNLKGRPLISKTPPKPGGIKHH